MRQLALGVVSAFGAWFSWFCAHAGVIGQVAGAIGACLGVMLTLIMIAVWLLKARREWIDRNRPAGE